MPNAVRATSSNSPVERFLDALAHDPSLASRIAHVQTEGPREAELCELPPDLPEPLVRALEAEGKSRIWRHQREALDQLAAGRNVCIATETSSGKSLCFQLPVLAAAMRDPNARALFLYPTNPLANDQETSLSSLIARLPPQARPRGLVKLHGGLGARKAELAASDPQLVLANPEMLHLYLLPQHRQWARFWSGLRYLVVDEIHLYRGAFGGHLANLLRRVRRCAWRYGAKPQVIAASATVGNPRALAQELCAAPFELVERSTAPRGPRQTVLWRPPPAEGKSGAYIEEAVELFRRALQANLQCILFARSRQLVETMASMLEERTGRSRIQLGVRAYRGGYTRDEREVIEAGLRAGKVRGVVTTNALEVGIDIGSLDVCVMAGYPGSIMAMRQQAGRVGRRERPSAIFLVASANPLDAYLVAHPELVCGAPAEEAVLGRLNPHVLRAHLACAAAEFPLWEAEVERFGGALAKAKAQELVERNEARWAQENGRRVLVSTSRAHSSVSLRSASQERFVLVAPDGESVGEIDGTSVAREAFPGAIYLHQGRSFRVDRHEAGRVLLKRAPAGLSTKVQGEREVSVREASTRRALAGAEVLFALVEVVDRYDRYLELAPRRTPRACRLEPPMAFELKTEALVLRPKAAQEALARFPPVSLEAALHATEHLLAAFGATFVLCDRDDLEGHSGLVDGEPAIVLFDRHPGGMGFAAAAFEHVEQIIERAGDAVDACPCESGCPACVHSGRCLRGNDEVSKAGAQLLLRLARGLPLDGVQAARVREQVPKPRPPKPRRDEFEPKSREEKLRSDAPWTPAFEVGEQVEHAVFGEGRVLDVRPSGRVVVDFGDGRSRKITPGWLRKL